MHTWKIISLFAMLLMMVFYIPTSNAAQYEVSKGDVPGITNYEYSQKAIDKLLTSISETQEQFCEKISPYMPNVNCKEEYAKHLRQVTHMYWVQQQIQQHDYGTFPDNYRELVENEIRKQLKDPYTADIHIDQPIKCRTYSMQKEVSFHWRVKASVNARNSFGGYTGHKDWYIHIEDGKVTYVRSGM